MNIRELIEKHARDNGYDGLFCPGECACEIGDLAPCGGEADCVLSCEFGYKSKCNENCSYHSDCDWHIGPTKEEESV